VRFRILGPLQVEDARGPIDIGGPKPRAVLAALLLAGGDVVPVDRLVNIVWGDRPPGGAVTALRAYISRLRRTLGVGADLQHRPPGYRLILLDATVDAVEFEVLVGAARAATAGGDRAGAVRHLDAARALWGGDALAEFVDEDFAAAAVRRLTELRAAAAEERLEALLELGRVSDVLPELEALVLGQPTRERPTAALMRALYATGRQADAITAYHHLRRRLDDELGVEPAAAIKDLYRRILRHDPAITGRHVPGNLPRRVSGFIGRGPDIDGVVRALRAGPLVTATGVGGVGKTRLAIEVATRDRQRFADGVWWCELGSLPDDGPVAHAVAAALGVQQRTGLSVEQTVIEYLRSRTALLVIDNCEHVITPASRLVAAVVQACPAVVVLATSRQPLDVDGEQVWPVAPLPVADATALFRQRARATAPELAVDPAAVRAICERLDCLPLAIELAAARTRAMTPDEIARRLDRSPLLGGGRGTAPRQHSLGATVEWSYRLLQPAEQLLFRHMSVFAGGADLRAVHRVAAPAMTEDAALDRLIGLVDRSMVVPVPGSPHSRYRILETLRAYGQAQVQADSAAGALARRHAQYYVDLAEHAAAGVQGPDEQAWVDQTLPDYDNLRAAYRHAIAESDIDLALRLVTAVPEFVHLRIGYEASEWAERLLDSVDSDHPRYPAAVGFAARGAWNRGDFRRARELARRAQDRDPPAGTPRIAYPRDVLADVALPEGDPDFTLRYYAAEAERARALSQANRLVWSLHCYAVCQAVCRRPHLGLPAARESLDVADGTANPTSLAIARYALGLVLKKSEPDQALTLLDEAARIAGSVRNRWWEGVALMEAAATRAVHGDPRVAARAFVRVLDLWDRIGDRTQQWQNLRYVARLLRRLGSADDAAELFAVLESANEQASITPRASLGVGPAIRIQPTAVLRARAMLDRLG
jgi:predicted ATPase/DNA-binding SARP family transcriptional activator